MGVNSSRSTELSGFRSLLELALCFVLAVIVLRGFFLEGYLVSSGSMAPGLLGFHKRVECPSCQHSFALGVQLDESKNGASVPADGNTDSVNTATCPNCGEIQIDVSAVPRNHGDQLLVHKNVFDFRRPRRWEPVVFRNPEKPREAYVKRVVGLPGESVLIQDGDLFINGSMARKDFRTQRDMRILVSDLSHIPNDESWELPWTLEGNWFFEKDGLLCHRTREGDSDAGDLDAGDAVSHSPETATLRLRPWRLSGGRHTVEVALSAQHAYPDWNEFRSRLNRYPVSWASRLEYDNDAEVLRCRGVMPANMQQNLMTSSSRESFRRAVFRLAALSHLAPVTDRYGYNARTHAPENYVNDLMLDATLELLQLPREIRLTIPVRHDMCELLIDPVQGQAELFSESSEAALRSSMLESGSQLPCMLRLEASGFDRRVTVAVNGREVFSSVDFPANVRPLLDAPTDGLRSGIGAEAAQTAQENLQQQQHLSLSVVGGYVRVVQLRLFRDVYYTPGRRTHAVDSPCLVPEHRYFVQGDNSPVSSDSRSWPDPFVPHRLLVGKPFAVHLPSRPGCVRLGRSDVSIRIPDFSRIRYIH